MGVGVGWPGARGRKMGIGADSAEGVGKLCADSSEEVDRWSADVISLSLGVLRCFVDEVSAG